VSDQVATGIIEYPRGALIVFGGFFLFGCFANFFSCSLIFWLSGYLVIWLSGYLVIWLSGYLVIWLSGYLVIWLSGYLVI
jgi:hypothetical protein